MRRDTHLAAQEPVPSLVERARRQEVPATEVPGHGLFFGGEGVGARDQASV